MNSPELQDAEIAFWAEGVLCGEVSVVKGCRMLAGPIRRFYKEADDELDWIVLVEAETEGMPLEEDEPLWLPESFASKRAELETYTARVRDHVLEACRILLQKTGAP